MNIANETSVNSPASSLSDEEKAFIQDYASLLAPWGLPPSAGRVFGYLLLVQEPASIDQIATELEMSRVSAWNSAKSLESFGHIRRYGTPGSKRALYAPSDSLDELFLRQANLIASVGTLLQHGASTIASEAAAEPLAERGRFYSGFSDGMKATLDKLNTERTHQG